MLLASKGIASQDVPYCAISPTVSHPMTDKYPEVLSSTNSGEDEANDAHPYKSYELLGLPAVMSSRLDSRLRESSLSSPYFSTRNPIERWKTKP